MPLPLIGNPYLARLIFARRNVQPPTTLYVNRDDYLAVRLTSPGVMWGKAYVRLRLLNVHGEVKHMQYVIGEPYWNTEVSARYPLDEGQLLGVEITPSNSAAHRGGIFATVELTRQSGSVGGEHAILAANYTSYYAPIGWPTSNPVSPEEGPGRDVRWVTGSPGNGNFVNVTMPLNARWYMKALKITLTTAAGGVNRSVFLTVIDSGGPAFQIGRASIQQPPGTDYIYRWLVDANEQALGIDNTVMVRLPQDFWIRSPDTVSIRCHNLQAGDLFGEGQWWIEQAVNL